MPVDVVEELENLIKNILGNRDAAQQYAEDPYGTLVSQGITEGDLEGLNMQQIVADSCSGLDLPESARSAVQSYTSGGGGGGYPAPPAGPATGVEQVMQHLNYVTYVAYEGDDIIQQEITNIDQSQNVNVEGEVHGDLTVDSHDINANATGDGSAASGTGPATVGDENLVNTGAMAGQQNTGDGAVLQSNVAGGGPINTGEFTGVQGDVGPGSVMSFGEGDAVNQIGNVVGPGGALSGSGDASGSYQDNDTTTTNVQDNDTTITETTDIHDIHDSQIATEQGPGDQHVQQDDGFDFVREPVRLAEREGGDDGDDGPEPLEAL